MAQTPLLTPCLANTETKKPLSCGTLITLRVPEFGQLRPSGRRETYLVGQQNTLKNRADLLSVVDEHAGDGRCAYQVAGAVVDIGEQADSAIAINRKRSGEGFVGKGTAHASILAPGSVAVEVKADHTHSGYRCRASRQD